MACCTLTRGERYRQWCSVIAGFGLKLCCCVCVVQVSCICVCVSLHSSGLGILQGSSFWAPATHTFLRVEVTILFCLQFPRFLIRELQKMNIAESKTVRVKRQCCAGVILGRGLCLERSNALLWWKMLELRSEGKRVYEANNRRWPET